MELSIIQNKIYEIRGRKVMLDRDLAEMYGVETRILNQAVKRNVERFPDDFMFQLSAEEFQNWKSQIVISNSIAMGLRHKPFAFTELGVSMLSSVLNSKAAIQVNMSIMRTFVAMRQLVLNVPMYRLNELQCEVNNLLRRQNKTENFVNEEFGRVYELIESVAEQKKLQGEKPKQVMGYKKYLN